jgi:uncharacterized protein YegL
MRRLPVYLLLDCSESMIGEGLHGLQQGLATLLRALRADPHALETVWLSCITFDREARLRFPLTELSDVQLPPLRVRPGTALGAALNLCADRIQTEVHKTTPHRKGDWRPLVILLTDGQPTDDWESALQRLGQKAKPRPANIYTIGCGDDVDVTALRELTDIVLHLREMTEEKFKKLFVWLTASITEGSRGVHEAEERPRICLDKLPEEIAEVDHAYPKELPDGHHQVLLFARCRKGKRPYLMRYRWDAQAEYYHPVSVHALELEPGDERSGFNLPAVNSSLLVGVAPCPHCNAAGAVWCGSCGGLMCMDPHKFVPTHCPHCGQYLDALNAGGSFDVRQSLG